MDEKEAELSAQNGVEQEMRKCTKTVEVIREAQVQLKVGCMQYTSSR